jgi:hypothetical protein
VGERVSIAGIDVPEATLGVVARTLAGQRDAERNGDEQDCREETAGPRRQA